MDDILTHERKRKWFVWGMVVTCTLSIPLIIGMSNAFRGISKEKATGLAAVAGGLSEAYLTFSAGFFFAPRLNIKNLLFITSLIGVRGGGVFCVLSLCCVSCL